MSVLLHHRRYWTPPLLALALLINVPQARAQTWNNANGGNWNTPGNWSTNAVPNSNGASATFGSVITSPQTVSVNAAITVGAITIANNNAYTLASSNGGTLTFNNNSSNATIGASGGFSGNHTISVNSTIGGNGVLEINQNSSGLMTISGNIGGSGGSLIKNGTGTLRLTGNSTYTGSTTINAGTVDLGFGVNRTNVLPSTTVVNLGANGILDLGDSTQQIAGLEGSGRLRVTGTGGEAEVLTINVANGARYEFTGRIDAPGDQLDIVKSGAGTQVFAPTATAGNSYGTTQVTAGTLLLNNSLPASGSATGTGNVSVTGGTLGGIGHTSSNITVSSGASIAPGDPLASSGIGTLTTGDVTLNAGSHFRVDINGTAGTSDRLAVNGDLTLQLTGNSNRPILDISLFGATAYGTQFTIATFTDLQGGNSQSNPRFSNYNGDRLGNNSTFTDANGHQWTIQYLNQSIVLTAVPEPGTLALLGIGMLGLAGLNWRRRRSVVKLS